MSYDLEIGTHERPGRAQVAAWAAEQALDVADEDGGFAVSRGDRHLFQVEEPASAEPDDFIEELAAACLAPRWMTRIIAPYPAPKRTIALARALARELAEANDGAAFDPQADGLLWPRGQRKRVPPRGRTETTSVVQLGWYLPPERWAAATGILLGLIRRRCPEALPGRYGRFEPPQHRYDPADPAAFERFVLDEEEGDGFWFASRPSFGGRWDGPSAWRREGHPRIGYLEVGFDGRVLDADARWRETVVDLFRVAARELGAFFAAAQVEPGWTVSANNRLSMSADTLLNENAEHTLAGSGWIGLPPFPMWLSWFGAPYAELVRSQLTPEAFAAATPPPGGLRRLLGRRPQLERTIEAEADGVFVRLGSEPRPASRLGGWPLPRELTFQARDRAAVIPPLRR